MKFNTLKQVLAFVLLCCSCTLFILMQQQFINFCLTTFNFKQSNKNGANKANNQHDNNRQQLIYMQQQQQQQQYSYFAVQDMQQIAQADNRDEINYFQPQVRLTNEMIDKFISEKTNNFTAQNKLLNINNVTYLLEPKKVIHCSANYSKKQSENISLPVESQWEKTKGLDLLIIINSKWDNFDRRQFIRSSWLNEKNVHQQVCVNLPKAQQQQQQQHKHYHPQGQLSIKRIQFVFALGKTQSDNNSTESSNYVNSLDTRIVNESRANGDLLVLDLKESYKSMSMKHLLIFKWILARAQVRKELEQDKLREKAKHEREQFLILKCDDDAQVNLSKLLQEFYRLTELNNQRNSDDDDDDDKFSEIERRQSKWSGADKEEVQTRQREALQATTNWIMCARFPANTKVLREPNTKWRLSNEEFHFDTFPAYCSGLAYLAPIELVRRLLALSHILLAERAEKQVKLYSDPLWVDDVFITGILFASMLDSPRIYPMNGHYCYTRAQRALLETKLNSTCLVSEIPLNAPATTHHHHHALPG